MKKKIILVDAVHAFVSTEGIMDSNIYRLLESYSENTKIILTNAPLKKFETYNLDKMPYKVFTLEKNPTKTNPEYYKEMFKFFDLKPINCIYIEHNIEAVKVAESLGIMSYHLNKDSKNYKELSLFISNNIT